MKRFLCVTGVLAAVATAAAQQPAAKPDFSTQSELVVLHVAVRDRKGGYVGGLAQDAFKVLENRRPQEITFFNNQDAPVTVGLVIDASGSMAPNRSMVIAENGASRSPKTVDGDRRKRRWRSLVGPADDGLVVTAAA